MPNAHSSVSSPCRRYEPRETTAGQHQVPRMTFIEAVVMLQVLHARINSWVYRLTPRYETYTVWYSAMPGHVNRFCYTSRRCELRKADKSYSGVMNRARYSCLKADG